MIDEKNVKRAIDDDLPSCETGDRNYPMHEFFLNAKGDKLTLSFDELGRTRGNGVLPDSAYKYDSWWWYDFENRKHRHALTWLTAGWGIEHVSLDKKQVVFAKFKITKIKFSVVSDSAPVQNANISFFYPNGTYLEAETDAFGDAYLALNDKLIGKEKTTLFCAKAGYEAFLVSGNELWQEQIILKKLRSGGSIICHGTCHIPNFTGRLNPILDKEKRTYLYATNVAIEGGAAQPFYFKVGKRFTLQDVDGKTIHLNIKAMIAGSDILEYEFAAQDFAPPKPNPPTAFSSTDSEKSQLIGLGHNNPPAEEAMTALDETIRSIGTINEPMENREELLTPMKTALESIKVRWISKDTLQNSIDALIKSYEIFIQIGDVAGNITKAIWKITALALLVGIIILL